MSINKNIFPQAKYSTLQEKKQYSRVKCFFTKNIFYFSFCLSRSSITWVIYLRN